jgi:hypothetical protein
MPDKKILQTGQHQLFLDDRDLAEQRDLAKIMHQPLKKGAVIRPDLINGGILETRCAPAWDPAENVYKLLMFGDGCTSYAESPDGVQWSKPHLYQKMINGSRANNIVTLDPELEWPQNCIFNMIYDPDEQDPARKFKGLSFCTDTKVLSFNKQPVVSPDCKRWTKLDVPLIRSQDDSSLSYDSITHTYIAEVKLSGPYGRSVFLTTSQDFEHWTEPELVFSADAEDQKLGLANIRERLGNSHLLPMFYNIPETYNVDVYNMGIFRYENYYIGMPSMYHQTGRVPPDWEGFNQFTGRAETLKGFRQSGDWGGFHHIQLACSRDLKSWHRLGGRKPFIDCSPVNAGAYDLSTILGVASPVFKGDELWFYYSGMKQYGGLEYEKDQSAICLATLRRDGFVSLDAGEKGGRLLTEAFTMGEGELHLNVIARKGRVNVAVLSEEGEILPGFTESRSLSGDHVDCRVSWENSRLATLAGRRIRLAISGQQAQFYSWWVG